MFASGGLTNLSCEAATLAVMKPLTIDEERALRTELEHAGATEVRALLRARLGFYAAELPVVRKWLAEHEITLNAQRVAHARQLEQLSAESAARTRRLEKSVFAALAIAVMLVAAVWPTGKSAAPTVSIVRANP